MEIIIEFIIFSILEIPRLIYEKFSSDENSRNKRNEEKLNQHLKDIGFWCKHHDQPLADCESELCKIVFHNKVQDIHATQQAVIWCTEHQRPLQACSKCDGTKVEVKVNK